MSLERLVEEIRRQADAELAKETARVEAELKQSEADRDKRIAVLRAESQRLATADAARERGQRVARAKVEGRKRVFEAKEARAAQQLARVRELLEEYRKSPDYAPLLKRMYANAVDQLGKSIRVSGRAEDAATLKGVAGRAFVAEPAPITGGLIAETTDGARRLNLSFDELLRLREDRVRALLA